ncbi:O-antigen ligase family protein [Oscillibacter sp. MSJ-2]|uniref:O-antigen ligase family protein n=1 Tax=Dysosmobacter acutus TaxID=2841504 RepID=A0ABS6F5U3_9FIRM|nr:O-antigen ligase family protein [Dysosmobacter acutus]MBU5625667.1 O-antigen ligase family protein [Dysosmobacter acutus]
MLCLLGASMSILSVVGLIQLTGANPFGLYPGGYSYFDAGKAYSGQYLTTIGNADLLAALLCAVLPAFALALFRGRERKRFLLTVPLVLCAVLAVRMRVAAGYVALIGAALILPPVLCREKRGRLALLSCALVCVGLAAVYTAGDALGATAGELSALLHGRVEDSFGSGRIYIWKEVLAIVPERLWFGGGPDTLSVRVGGYFERYDPALALVLLLSLLPMPVSAKGNDAPEESFSQSERAYDAAGETLNVGGETVGPGERASGIGWSYNGTTGLTLESAYTGEPISATLTHLTIQAAGEVSVAGIFSTGRVDFNLTDPAYSLSVTGAEGQSAVTANMLVFGSAPKGILRLRSGGAGIPALNCAALMLPTAEGYDEQSTNVVLRAGTSDDTARVVTEYSGQEYVYWELTECEVLFLSDGRVAARQNLPLSQAADIRMIGAPEKSGGIFLGWSNGAKVYQPGQTASVRLSYTKEIF